jgi:hypothetical protein
MTRLRYVIEKAFPRSSAGRIANAARDSKGLQPLVEDVSGIRNWFRLLEISMTHNWMYESLLIGGQG